MKGVKINNKNLKSNLEIFYCKKIKEIRQYGKGKTGAFFYNGSFRFITLKGGFISKENKIIFNKIKELNLVAGIEKK